VLFLSFTVPFFIGTTLIHSYFSSAAKPAGTLITGVLLIGLSGLADAAVGLAMRQVLTPCAPVRSQLYFVLRVAEGLAVLAACAYFLTSRSQWNDYALPAYALSAVAGLVLTRSCHVEARAAEPSILGIAGYALSDKGSSAICSGSPHRLARYPAGIVFLAPVACSSSCSAPLIVGLFRWKPGRPARSRALPGTGTSRPPRRNTGAAPQALAAS
jgi:hypothetical protein